MNEWIINEPHIGNAPKKLRFGGKPRAQRIACRARKGPRGNPVISSKGTSYFNDALGTTVGAKSGKTYSAATLSAFGARELEKGVGVGERRENLFYTGKPEVEGLGHAFLMRNYRAGLGKWQTADPMGYPDGWNAMAYCGNGVTDAVDLWGCALVSATISKNANSTIGSSGSVIPSRIILQSQEYTYYVHIDISVWVDSTIKRSCAYDYGTIATYTLHCGRPDDAYLTPVYEAVREHEWGHAEYLKTTFRQKLEESLSSLEDKWRDENWDWERAKREAESKYDSVYSECLKDLCNAANGPTLDFFQRSDDWMFIGVATWKVVVGGNELTRVRYAWKKVE